MGMTYWQRWRLGGWQWLTLVSLLIGLGGVTPGAWGQSLEPAERDQFLSDPEMTEPRDPLLPVLPIQRPLSPLERQALATELDRLALEGEQLYRQGDGDGAFEIWIRELRLRRILGLGPELTRLRAVGQRAWELSRTPEAQLLTLRLDQIREELLAQATPPLDLVVALATGYETLRSVDAAIALYQILGERAAQAGEVRRQIQLLERIGQLQEAWFRFFPAANTYRQLVELGQGQGIPLAVQQGYLRRAIDNFEQGQDWGAAIALQQRLLQQYETAQRREAVPPLKLAIARNYSALNRLDLALPLYQETYRLALEQEQSLYAREVVSDLVVLYQAADQPEDVRYLYRQLLAVERLSYNAYGIMLGFEGLGELYEAQGKPEQAIAAYQEALIMAHHLGHRQADFEIRIRRIRVQQGMITVADPTQHQRDPAVESLSPPVIWQENPAP